MLSFGERKSAIVNFIDVIKKANFLAEISGIDLDWPDDEFDYDYYDISVSNKDRIRRAYISIRLDLGERKYWVSADDGYYVIGQKRSLESQYENQLVRLLGALLEEDTLDVNSLALS